MANNTGLIVGVVVVAGAIGWYWNTQRDTTPVGLVVANNLTSTQSLGANTDGDVISYQMVEGTFREDESSVGVASVSADEPLLVILSNGEPVSAKVVKIEEWTHDENNPEYADEMERIDALNAYLDRIISLMNEVGMPPEAIEEVENSKQTEEDMRAESIFGPTLSLQSHFVW